MELGEPIANAAFNDQVAGGLISQGHVWLGFALVILQVAVLPVIIHFIKSYTAGVATRNQAIINAQKAQVDAERMATKLDRDNQMNLLNMRLDVFERDRDKDLHRYEEMTTAMEKRLDRLELKIDQLIGSGVIHAMQAKA